MRLRIVALLALALTIPACAATVDDADATAESDTTGRSDRGGRGAPAGANDDEAGEALDDTDPDDTSGGGAGDDPTGDGDAGSGSTDEATTDPVDTPDGGCAAGSINDAVACQVDANDAFVDAFCGCFTDSAYGGDRGACVADQPGADAFAPNACSRAALLTDEAGSIRTSLCYADAVYDLADCVAVCPADEAAFDACFAAVGAAFDACDVDRPAAVADALAACETDTPADPGTDPDDGGTAPATRGLQVQRDAYVTAYCGCAVGSEFGDLASCRTTMQGRWDPGLSACEADAFAAMPAAAAPFVTCITESFVIAETACMECPAPGSIEHDLCTDPAVDINFCFMDADPALQDALLACPR